ncbi:MAG: hypothetical protein OYL92_03565 [Acidobacteriota bacterium]|nr:hypothetical protein [Acidobacteriota bacterium]MDE2924377.1 hypothetical protein [Acidobacteriota bacterium]MDE3264027.1 hypothetical protein [Acidobacteriota bacterium]
MKRIVAGGFLLIVGVAAVVTMFQTPDGGPVLAELAIGFLAGASFPAGLVLLYAGYRARRTG